MRKIAFLNQYSSNSQSLCNFLSKEVVHNKKKDFDSVTLVTFWPKSKAWLSHETVACFWSWDLQLHFCYFFLLPGFALADFLVIDREDMRAAMSQR